MVPDDVVAADPPVRRSTSRSTSTKSLAASQVVARLPTLTTTDLEVVRTFEAAHRAGERSSAGSTSSPLPTFLIHPLAAPVPPRCADVGPLRVLEAEARTHLIEARGGGRWLQEHPADRLRMARRPSTRSTCSLADLELDDDLPGLVVGFLVLDVDLPIARVDQVYVTPPTPASWGSAMPSSRRPPWGPGPPAPASLEGEALPGDRDTKNLYERAGITARLITVSATAAHDGQRPVQLPVPASR